MDGFVSAEREHASSRVLFDAPYARRTAPLLRSIHPARSRYRKSQCQRRPLGGASKRLTDVIVALAALILLAPVMLTIAVLIRLETPGPSLFCQRRGGFKGRTFIICKFRTMTSLDDGKTIAQATPDDARVTRIGAFLRKTSLDELPQLFNVLRGEMSIVGPRAHCVAHDAQFAAIDPRYRQRQEARPGITGLAQVSGCRGLAPTAESVKARVNHDLAYIETWNWRSDIWIMFRTALLLIRDKHAY